MSDPHAPGPEREPGPPSAPQNRVSERSAPGDLHAQAAPDQRHPVTDRYVARRLAEGAVARAERERQEAAEIVGEPPTRGAFLFYLLLGVVISLLLLVAIFRASEPPPEPVKAPRAPATSARPSSAVLDAVPN